MKSSKSTLVVVLVLLAVLAGGFYFFAGKPAPVVSNDLPPAAAEAVAVAPAEAPALDGVPPMPAVAGVAPGGAFSLVDQTGALVTEASWPDKYKLVFFGFTNCPDICPAGLSKIAEALNAYPEAADKIVPILITVDPARDTVSVMADYVSKFHPAIVGLTGSEEQVKDAISAYKVYAAKRPLESHDGGHGAHEGHEDYTVDHSGYMYLMSPDDVLLDVIGTDETAEGIVAKIKLRLGE